MAKEKNKAKAETKGVKEVKKNTKKKVLGGVAKKGLTAVMGLVMFGLFVLTGCQTADPSPRGNKVSYGNINVYVYGDGNSVTVDIGDGVVADASGGGDTLSNSPTQTTDVKPETAVAWGGSTAGTGGGSSSSIVTRAIGKLWGWITGKSDERLDDEEVNALNECVGGNCEL